jgi:large subunit ribosomal protein L13
MKPKLQRTFSPKPSDVERIWFVVDAGDAPLGRLASEVASLLRGKHKPTYAPHIDGGDYVVVVNASRVKVTGRKDTDKIYYRHSGYPGGLRAASFSRVRETQPERLIEAAVRGMLPKTKLGKQMLSKLKVYGGAQHPHAAQRPQQLDIDYRKVEG